ncbi:MAG: hypothetical protein NZ761_09090 [Dehalococcoidia bacterium]|nr:hypothetical protein [Dehalococcoidia bacterium]
MREVVSPLSRWLRDRATVHWEADVTVVFVTQLLGSTPPPGVGLDFLTERQKEKLREELGPEAPVDELLAEPVAEPAAAEETTGFTCFPRVEGRPVLLDYQWKGYFKEKLEQLRLTRPSFRGKGQTARLRPEDVTQYLFVLPSTLFLETPDGEPVTEERVGLYVRPVRFRSRYGATQTALSVSEALQPPIVCRYRLEVRRPVTGETIWTPYQVAQMLELGERHGFGQFRNGGFGRFLVQEFEVRGWDEES